MGQGKNLSVNAAANSLTSGAGASLRRAFSDRLTMPEAIEAVGRMLTGYPNASKTAPDSYVGTIAALLCEYPKSTALRCADPLHGVATTTKFLPTVADVVQWCQPHLEGMTRIVDFDERSERQLRERQ